MKAGFFFSNADLSAVQLLSLGSSFFHPDSTAPYLKSQLSDTIDYFNAKRFIINALSPTIAMLNSSRPTSTVN